MALMMLNKGRWITQELLHHPRWKNVKNLSRCGKVWVGCDCASWEDVIDLIMFGEANREQAGLRSAPLYRSQADAYRKARQGPQKGILVVDLAHGLPIDFTDASGKTLLTQMEIHDGSVQTGARAPTAQTLIEMFYGAWALISKQQDVWSEATVVSATLNMTVFATPILAQAYLDKIPAEQRGTYEVALIDHWSQQLILSGITRRQRSRVA